MRTPLSEPTSFCSRRPPPGSSSPHESTTRELDAVNFFGPLTPTWAAVLGYGGSGGLHTLLWLWHFASWTAPSGPDSPPSSAAWYKSLQSYSTKYAYVCTYAYILLGVGTTVGSPSAGSVGDHPRGSTLAAANGRSARLSSVSCRIISLVASGCGYSPVRLHRRLSCLFPKRAPRSLSSLCSQRRVGNLRTS